MPTLTVFAGPNGSVEPDAIALRIKPGFAQEAGISAGREVLQRTAEYVRNAESFAIETTLSGNWTNSAIRAALEQSFLTRLFYICVDSPEWSIR